MFGRRGGDGAAADGLLPSALLPRGFVYPALFVRLFESGFGGLEPWWVLEGDLLRDRRLGLRDRYPRRDLVPFARREDNDDVACWAGTASEVHVVHDYASSGWEQRETVPDFAAWLRRAVEDCIASD